MRASSIKGGMTMKRTVEFTFFQKLMWFFGLCSKCGRHMRPMTPRAWRLELERQLDAGEITRAEYDRWLPDVGDDLDAICPKVHEGYQDLYIATARYVRGA